MRQIHRDLDYIHRMMQAYEGQFDQYYPPVESSEISEAVCGLCDQERMCWHQDGMVVCMVCERSVSMSVQRGLDNGVTV